MTLVTTAPQALNFDCLECLGEGRRVALATFPLAREHVITSHLQLQPNQQVIFPPCSICPSYTTPSPCKVFFPAPNHNTKPLLPRWRRS